MKHRLSPWCLFASTALALAANAGEPPQKQHDPQAATEGSLAGSKVGVDKKTGRLRPLTPAESAELDAQTAAQNKAARGQRQTIRFPSTPAEVAATRAEAGGIVMEKPAADSLSSVSVTRNADGTLTYSENGEPLPPAKAKREEVNE